MIKEPDDLRHKTAGDNHRDGALKKNVEFLPPTILVIREDQKAGDQKICQIFRKKNAEAVGDKIPAAQPVNQLEKRLIDGKHCYLRTKARSPIYLARLIA